MSRVSAGWTVSETTGASLAVVLDRVEADLRSGQEHARQVAIQLAGPRATAVMLAALPVLGVLLGTAIGARPMHVLLDTAPGQIALLLGALLDGIGVMWTAHLVRDRTAPS